MDNENRTEILAGYYRGLNDFSRSEKYSRDGRIVYVSADYSGWLVADWKSRDRVQVRLTEEEGRVKAWDNYLADGTDIRLLSAIRRAGNGKERVAFMPEEIKILLQFDYGDRKETISILTDMISVIKDRQKREILESTAGKIGKLTEEDLNGLAEVMKKQFEIEMGREIKTRSNEVNAQKQKR